MRKFLIILIFSFSFFCGFSQEEIVAEIETEGKMGVSAKRFPDSLSLANFLNQELEIARRKGYLFAEIPKISGDSNTNYKVNLKLGEKFSWGKITIVDSLNQPLTVKNLTLEGNAVSYFQLEKEAQELLDRYGRSGYLFAQIIPQSLEIIGAEINMNLQLLLGDQITLDSIRISGSNKVSKKYLERYLGLKPNEFLNLKNLEDIESRLNELPFLSSNGPPKVYFYNKNAVVYVYVKDRQINQFDGVVGFFPNPNGGLQLTGDFNLQLYNSFKVGELLGLKYRSVNDAGQQLNVNLAYPFLLGLPVLTTGTFDLFKRDTTFLDLNTRLGFSVINFNKLRAGFFFQNRSVNVPVVSSAGLGSTSGNFYGVNLSFQQVDFLPNPTKGLLIRTEFSAGNKRFTDSDEDFQIPQYQYGAEINYWLRLGGRFTIYNSLVGRGIASDRIFSNERYRFGGFGTFRGFNEEGLNATDLVIFNIEPRFLLDQQSFLYAFYSNAHWKDFSVATLQAANSANSVGLGISFATPRGLLSLAYALGALKNQALEFRTAKVHFGYRVFI